MKNFKKVSIPTVLILFTLLLIACSLSTISAANQTINDTSTGGILGGIGNASAGDTVFLQPGTYNKTGNDTNITISKNITLQGNGSKDSVIVDAQGLSRIFTINNNLNVTFINITFINGYYEGNGGAIYNSNSNLTFVNCTFTNNVAVGTGYGGAIYTQNNMLTVVDCTFNDNKAGSFGAGISAITTGVRLTIINSTFDNNSVGSNGGAIYNPGTNGIITNCTFTNNNANYGGAIYHTGTNGTMTNCTFTNNNAIMGGGAIDAAGGVGRVGLSIINTIFNNNNATSSGAFFASTFHNITIVNCTFANNNASSNGGAIGNYNSANITIVNCTFANNNAGSNGGAIMNNFGLANINVSGCNFTNNAGGTGGIIYNNATMNVSGNNMSDNSASGNGGVIYNNVNMSVSSNTMSGNTAGLGQMIYNNGNMGILNLTYLSNSTVKTSKGSNVTVYTTLTDDMGNTVTGQNISFYVDGVFIDNVTSIEGEANITYLVTQGPVSVIPVTGDYVGHNGYSIVLKNGELLVLKIPTKITISVPKEVKVGDTVTLEGKLTDENGNHLVGKTVDFYVDGVKVGSGVTDSNGIAKLNYTFNKAGRPNVEAKFAGDNTYLASNATNQTTVSKIKTTITVKTDKDKIIATLTDENGNLLVNKKVTITINGKTYTRTTDSSGQVIIKYKNAWNYKVTAKFAGDEKYLASKASAPKRTATKITIDRQGDKVIVTLKDKKGRVLAFKTVRVVIDGQEFVGTTDENGQFIIQYKNPKRFTITAKFDGDDMYIESEATLPPEGVADSKTNAAMKETGLPVIPILLSILGILGFGIRRKQN